MMSTTSHQKNNKLKLSPRPTTKQLQITTLLPALICCSTVAAVEKASLRQQLFHSTHRSLQECTGSDPQKCGCDSVDQVDYRGTLSVSESGLPCQRWDAQSPHKPFFTLTSDIVSTYGLEENYCRNPLKDEPQAWCYTTDPDVRWEHCNVPFCGSESCIPDPPTCGCESDGQADYRGTISETAAGLTCQRWDSQSPHSHTRTAANYPSSGLEENYCRNPDGEPRAWCYTTDPGTRWAFCDVPFCSATATTTVSSLRHCSA